jgi:hypothetical protein
MPKRRRTQPKRPIDRQKAHALLNPAAAFLRASGFTKAQALNALATAFDEVSMSRGRRKVELVGHPLHADILQAWCRRRKYLDAAGNPRTLAFGGRFGFEALAREVDPRIDARETLDVLIRYGSVRRSPRGGYRLVRPVLGVATNRTVAFEPTANFLSHANYALSRSLTIKQRKRPGPFWYRVEGFCRNAATERRFRGFARDRGLLFLEELDDWLEAHNSRDPSPASSRTRRRVGVGLFSFRSKVDYT